MSKLRPKWFVKSRYFGQWREQEMLSEKVARTIVDLHVRDGRPAILEKWVCEHRDRSGAK